MKIFRDGSKRYQDDFNRWRTNDGGKAELLDHLEQAVLRDLDVRLVIAKPDDPEADIYGDASVVKKTFRSIAPSWAR